MFVLNIRTGCPCKDCQDRSSNCHSKCEKYIEWKQKRAEIHDRYMRDKEKQIQLDLRKREAVHKFYQQNRGRKK